MEGENMDAKQLVVGTLVGGVDTSLFKEFTIREN